ncbi:MAG TPA: hypothetical protein VER08_08170 [Pyrinomonadaceae bacterium]|nr:hypothetical protein [Pyrinomonadaceae bacterium]
MKRRAKAATKERGKVEKNWLEWAVFGVGLALVLGTLGLLIYDGAAHSGVPPDIRIELGAAERSGEGFVVPVTVTNRGDVTAEGVRVEVVLEAAGAEPERSNFDIAFLPRRARREGWVGFRADPRHGQLKPRVLGYGKP